MNITKIDSILFFLSEGDPVKKSQLRKCKVKDIYEYYYLKRAQSLNTLLDSIAHAQHLERERLKK